MPYYYIVSSNTDCDYPLLLVFVCGLLIIALMAIFRFFKR